MPPPPRRMHKLKLDWRVSAPIPKAPLCPMEAVPSRGGQGGMREALGTGPAPFKRREDSLAQLPSPASPWFLGRQGAPGSLVCVPVSWDLSSSASSAAEPWGSLGRGWAAVRGWAGGRGKRPEEGQAPAQGGLGWVEAQGFLRKPLLVNEGEGGPQALKWPHPQQRYPDSPAFGCSFWGSLIRSNPNKVSPSLTMLQQGTLLFWEHLFLNNFAELKVQVTFLFNHLKKKDWCKIRLLY